MSRITLEKIRHLPVSAASGLVIDDDTFFIIADDELQLSAFSFRDDQYHQKLPLFSGELPVEKHARKKHKPDLEALAHLPPMAGYPHGALLAVGSGSAPQRQRAVILAFNVDGKPGEVVTVLDLAPLYASLSLPDINIEGAFVMDQQLVLMQRGNNADEQNALVYCPLEPLLQGHVSNHTVMVNLPTIDNIPLGFTDGLYLPSGNILFSAVAENSGDSYNDGPCVGAAIGELDAQGRLLYCQRLAQPLKIEGIALADNRLYAVTDADDAAVPAGLYRVGLPAV